MGLVSADITNNHQIKWDWQVRVHFLLPLNSKDMAVCSHIVTLETEANRGFIIYRAICSGIWDSWPIIPCKMLPHMAFNLDYHFTFKNFSMSCRNQLP